MTAAWAGFNLCNKRSVSCFFGKIFAIQSRAEGSAEPSANGAAVHELT
jgi:hypothetical protein